MPLTSLRQSNYRREVSGNLATIDVGQVKLGEVTCRIPRSPVAPLCIVKDEKYNSAWAKTCLLYLHFLACVKKSDTNLKMLEIVIHNRYFLMLVKISSNLYTSLNFSLKCAKLRSKFMNEFILQNCMWMKLVERGILGHFKYAVDM